MGDIINTDDVYNGSGTGGKLGVMNSLVGPIAGAWLGGLLGQNAREEQMADNLKLQENQIKGSKELAQYQNKMQMDMWHNTNYQAQMEEMRKAGVNPALVYGKGGGGGTTTGGGMNTSVNAGNAPDANSRVASQMNAMMMASQIALTQAQTEKTKAEAGAIPTTIANVGADTANKLTQNEIQELELKFRRETFEDAQKTIQANTSKAISEAQIATNQSVVGRETQDKQIKIIEQKAIGETLINASIRKGIQLDQAKIEEITAKILQGWEGLKQGDERIAIEKFRAEIDAQYPNLMNTLGRGVDDGVEALFRATGPARMKYKTVKP